MATTAFIAMTIEVTDPSDDKFVARHQAEQLSHAINLILRGGPASVYTSVISDTEPKAVVDLAKYVQDLEFDAVLTV